MDRQGLKILLVPAVFFAGAWILTLCDGAQGAAGARAGNEKLVAEAHSPLLPPPPAWVSTALSADGYVVDGSVNGSVARFAIDTGANGSQIPQAVADELASEGKGPSPTGSTRVTLADGSKREMKTYIVSAMCVAGICAHDLEVTVAPDGLIGTDFIEATGAEIRIADGALTMEGPQP
jgi:predicted aspartyl protease